MPSITRKQCRCAQERKLWDECHAAERRASVMLALVREVASAAVEVFEGEPEHTLADVTPEVQRSVMSAAAARARCFRRDFSNTARRRALDDAKRIGALPQDFDERSLPWKNED